MRGILKEILLIIDCNYLGTNLDMLLRLNLLLILINFFLQTFDFARFHLLYRSWNLHDSYTLKLI